MFICQNWKINELRIIFYDIKHGRSSRNYSTYVNQRLVWFLYLNTNTSIDECLVTNESKTFFFIIIIWYIIFLFFILFLFNVCFKPTNKHYSVRSIICENLLRFLTKISSQIKVRRRNILKKQLNTLENSFNTKNTRRYS